MKWQPIETAPKDGTKFQAWMHNEEVDPCADACWEPECRFNSDGAFQVWGRVDYDCDGWDFLGNSGWEPTHWMPLPEAPK